MSQSRSCGPPCSGVSSSPGPQSTISAGTSPSASHGVRASQPAASAAASRWCGDLVLARDHDEAPVAAAGLRRRRVGGRPGRVGVPALAGLAAVAAARGELRGQRRGAPARLVRLGVEGRGDRGADVHADEVHQREGAHPEAAGAAADAVHLLGGGEPLLHDPQRLEREGPVAAVDQEAGAVAGLDRPPCPSPRRAARARARAAGEEATPATSSASRIRGTGLKKCRPTTRSGPGTPAAIALTSSDDVFVASTASSAHHGGERAEQRALDLEVLRRGLDDHVARREVGELEGALDVRVVHPHVEPGGARRLGDAGAHRAGAGHPEQHARPRRAR